MSDRLRKFFRVRGKTGFVLDEVVVPVVLVQDLTEGPYQAGVTPAAGESRIDTIVGPWSLAIVLNDKPGSLTPVLDDQFNGRSFSFTFADIQNVSVAFSELQNLQLKLSTREQVVAAGVPIAATSLTSIQENDGTKSVPVEMFTYQVTIFGTAIWRGILGDNTNTIGSRRTFDDTKPNITIGPGDALVWTSPDNASLASPGLLANVRGFYQEQPA